MKQHKHVSQHIIVKNQKEFIIFVLNKNTMKKTKKQLLLEKIQKETTMEEFNEDWKILYKMDSKDLNLYLRKIKQRKQTFYFELI
jgi:hypothetical protein